MVTRAYAATSPTLALSVLFTHNTEGVSYVWRYSSWCHRK